MVVVVVVVAVVNFFFNVRKKAGSICSRMSAALVHSTFADNCFALKAAFVRSICFQCSRLRISRFTGPFDSSMSTSTRAHSDIRTVYADTVEHARLFKSISGVQRYSLQRSMRADM